MSARSPEETAAILSLAQSPEQRKKRSEGGILHELGEYGKSAVKGFMEGLGQFGRALGPTGTSPEAEKLAAQARQEKGLPQQAGPETYQKFLEEAIPTEGGFGPEALRRGAKNLPLALTGGGPGQAIARSGAAGFLGETAKELGAPESVQAIVEAAPFVAPSLKKILLSEGKHKPTIDEARKFGLSDEEITPLIQGGKKIRTVGKLGKGEKTDEAMKATKEALSNAYQTITANPIAHNQQMTIPAAQKFYSDIAKRWYNMPHGVRDTVKQDTVDLIKGRQNIDRLINWWQDINWNLGPETKQLSLFKEPIKEAIESVSPEIAKDFESINKLFEKFHAASKILSPSISNQVLPASKAAAIGAAMATGNSSFLTKIFGYVGAKKVAEQMLTNPRYQQLGLKMSKAVAQNKIPIAVKIAHSMGDLVMKTDKQIGEELKKVSEEDMRLLQEHRPTRQESKK